MVQQKMVMKLTMGDAKKRSKALKTAVGLPGVQSVTLEEDKIVIVGEGVDSVNLTRILRKKMGYVDLVSVGENKKEEKKDPQPLGWPQPIVCIPSHAYIQDPYPGDNSGCIIM